MFSPAWLTGFGYVPIITCFLKARSPPKKVGVDCLNLESYLSRLWMHLYLRITLVILSQILCGAFY